MPVGVAGHGAQGRLRRDQAHEGVADDDGKRVVELLAEAADPARRLRSLLFDRPVGACTRDAPQPGTAASRDDLATAVANLLRAFSRS
jgi:hypothetical protein